MKFDPDIHHRQSIRLRGYDYASVGAYFITVCTRNRESLFGEVLDGEMQLNDAGWIVRQVWEELPQRFPSIALDACVVMPNHVHGIVIVGAQFIAPNVSGVDHSHPVAGNRVGVDRGGINRDAVNRDVMNQGAMNRAPTDSGDLSCVPGVPVVGDGGVMNRGVMNHGPTLGEIVRTFKAVSAREIRRNNPPVLPWQRNYYEHIIRDDEELNRVRQYIANNPMQWGIDRENPTGRSRQDGESWQV